MRMLNVLTSTSEIKTRHILSVSVMVFFLTGCADKNISDLNDYISKVHSRPKAQIEPLPEITVVETFLFKPDGLRDPFKPVERFDDKEGMQMASGKGIHPDFSRRKEELESFDLNTLRMVGSVAKNVEMWGLVKVSDGSGTIHRVRVGNYLGKNFGKIIRIEEGGIELMEIIQDETKSGKWKEHQASLALAE